MAILRYAGNTLIGTSSERLADTASPNGTRFFETDTLKIYIKISGTWSQVSGYSGFSGVSGRSGFSGYSGISGRSGFSGINGTIGLSGYSGRSGFSGINGTIGLSGYSGFSGARGISGYSGISGRSGFSGARGISGYSGIPGNSYYGVDVKITNYTIQINEPFKTIMANSESDITFTLPSVDSSHIGIEYTLGKIGKGQLIIQASDNDTIEDSGPGKTIYCKDEDFAIITLKLISATQWVLKTGGNGTWITTY